MTGREAANDASPSADELHLIRRLEESEAEGLDLWCRALMRLRPELGAWSEPVGDGHAVCFGRMMDVNHALGLGLREAVMSETLDHLESLYRSSGLPPKVDLSPASHPSLAALLQERGYAPVKHFTLYVNDAPPSGGPPADPPGVRIETLKPGDEDLWVHTSGLGFSDLDDGEPLERNVTFARICVDLPQTTCLMARADGEPAGTGALIVREGLGVLISASTKPANRGRGIQQALIDRRVRMAFEAGCDAVCVKTDPGNASSRNIVRAGFRMLYRKSVYALA